MKTYKKGQKYPYAYKYGLVCNTLTQLLQGSYGHSGSGVGGEKSGEIYQRYGTSIHLLHIITITL